jgi:hypothetical protein
MTHRTDVDASINRGARQTRGDDGKPVCKHDKSSVGTSTPTIDDERNGAPYGEGYGTTPGASAPGAVGPPMGAS